MPRAKRSKQYRKLMEQFSMGWGFREPYQVLVDADFISEANRCKMDLIRRLEDTLHGQVKPMITQCSMRHLYAQKSEPGVEAAIELAKSQFERRRCGHHPNEYPTPLSTSECLHSVVDPKDNGVNRHRYVCAINDDAVRANLRQVAGTPLLFIRRSVMIMEPMATVSAKARSKDEKSKFRAEIKRSGDKRKREEEEEDGGGGSERKDTSEQSIGGAVGGEKTERKKKKTYGRKEPNPLSVKKKKKKPEQAADDQHPKTSPVRRAVVSEKTEGGEAPKRKRRRKHKGSRVSAGDEAASTVNGPTATATDAANED
ncbi:hypothetical protein GGS23DRAFT_570998 [Durotheca rogersii]|uniref:uncharacterized protein n=1 Tax=Durotheca rogersii TaxID=419775 RepID=UPI002220BF58|nr:uncharacterized protein GGS23DRAFT_570998 [Durotheca rogersii]KAI5862609.1 hypothetical protein GGS23DRAFT_570998 [Durotheca rogersii]